MEKPIIGVTPLWDEEKNSYWMLPGYLEGVKEAGAIPVILPLTTNGADIAQLVDLCDGFLFTGGQDVDPQLYPLFKSSLKNGVLCYYLVVSDCNDVKRIQRCGEIFCPLRAYPNEVPHMDLLDQTVRRIMLRCSITAPIPAINLDSFRGEIISVQFGYRDTGDTVNHSDHPENTRLQWSIYNQIKFHRIHPPQKIPVPQYLP